jgi:hypothetical protein
VVVYVTVCFLARLSKLSLCNLQKHPVLSKIYLLYYVPIPQLLSATGDIHIVRGS